MTGLLSLSIVALDLIRATSTHVAQPPAPARQFASFAQLRAGAGWHIQGLSVAQTQTARTLQVTWQSPSADRAQQLSLRYSVDGARAREISVASVQPSSLRRHYSAQGHLVAFFAAHAPDMLTVDEGRYFISTDDMETGVEVSVTDYDEVTSAWHGGDAARRIGAALVTALDSQLVFDGFVVTGTAAEPQIDLQFVGDKTQTIRVWLAGTRLLRFETLEGLGGVATDRYLARGALRSAVAGSTIVSMKVARDKRGESTGLKMFFGDGRTFSLSIFDFAALEAGFDDVGC